MPKTKLYLRLNWLKYKMIFIENNTILCWCVNIYKINAKTKNPLIPWSRGGTRNNYYNSSSTTQKYLMHVDKSHWNDIWWNLCCIICHYNGPLYLPLITLECHIIYLLCRTKDYLVDQYLIMFIHKGGF